METFYTEFNTIRLGNIESMTRNSMMVYVKCDGHRGNHHIIHRYSTILAENLKISWKSDKHLRSQMDKPIWYAHKKVNLFLCTPWRDTSGLKARLHSFITRCVGEWSAIPSEQWTPNKHWQDLVGTKDSLHILQKRKNSCLCPESNPHYTDRTTPTPVCT